MSDALWTSDFAFDGRQVTVRKTGAALTIDRAVLGSVASWLAFYLPVKAVGAVRGVLPGPRVWFAPDRPRPWYLVWAAAAWGGVRFARSPQEADAAFYFDDATRGAPPPTGLPALNFGCDDISKSRVAEVFAEVFGYPLAVDPSRHVGPAVEKGEANGAHDGRIVDCPRPPRPGKVYQRVIDNLDYSEAVDLRTPFVGGRPVVVFIKRRPSARRFANDNSRVALAKPQDLFTATEIDRLSAFCAAMRLDWGGLDILRDRRSGRLYVVDVNKTDMGPPTALPWALKILALSRIARAFRALVSSRRKDRP